MFEIRQITCTPFLVTVRVDEVTALSFGTGAHLYTARTTPRGYRRVNVVDCGENLLPAFHRFFPRGVTQSETADLDDSLSVDCEDYVVQVCGGIRSPVRARRANIFLNADMMSDEVPEYAPWHIMALYAVHNLPERRVLSSAHIHLPVETRLLGFAYWLSDGESCCRQSIAPSGYYFRFYGHKINDCRRSLPACCVPDVISVSRSSSGQSLPERSRGR